MQGDAIEAFGSIRNKSFFDSKMQLQSCYKIGDYLSEAHRKGYNTVPHQATIKLTNATTFIPLPDADIPNYYFNFTPFESLKDSLNSTYLLTGMAQKQSLQTFP